MNKNPLLGLETFGQSVWLDYLRRNALDNGEIQGLINDDGVSGLTSIHPSLKRLSRVVTITIAPFTRWHWRVKALKKYIRR